MRKLVLAISAVFLLQIAFYVFMAVDRPAVTKLRPSRIPTLERRPQLTRVDDPQEVIRPATRTPAELSSQRTQRTNLKAAVRSDLPRTTAKRDPEIERRKRTERNSGPTYFAARSVTPRYPAEWAPRPVQARSVIPRGYTMVLVDYTPTGASTLYAKDISRPRKRSYLARALPALVKKPWNWMKSIASKLD